MYLMKMNVENLEELRKVSEEKQTVLDHPIIVKSKLKQFVIAIDKGEYNDYISPCVLELELEKLEEIYLILEFHSAMVHDILTHTEKYEIIDFEEGTFDVMLHSLND